MGLFCTDMFLYRLKELLCHSLEIGKQIIFLIFSITQLNIDTFSVADLGGRRPLSEIRPPADPKGPLCTNLRDLF